METNYVENQWKICVLCGCQKIKGDYAKRVVEKWVAEGRMTLEQAEAYVDCPTYLECPRAEEHGAVGLLPFNQLEHGSYYHGNCRNATFARWNAEKKCFVYMREKFGEIYPEEIGYWIEAKPGEHRFDEFKPYGKMKEVLFEIPMTAY